jgi:hypothetical protein
MTPEKLKAHKAHKAFGQGKKIPRFFEIIGSPTQAKIYGAKSKAMKLYLARLLYRKVYFSIVIII